MFMNEFAERIRQEAAHALRPLFQQQASTETDPIVELIGFLLEDGAGGVLSAAEVPVTTNQWLTWHQLAMERENEVTETMARVLEEERVELPTKAEAMQQWAAWLLLSTLDRMEMA
jgi:hypothetical protein